MKRSSPGAGLGGRTQQAGTAVAATMMPLTFQRTLMPKSTVDQALITGIAGALNYGVPALIQDTVEAVALRASGAASPDEVDLKTWRRASFAVDLAAIALGLVGQLRYRQVPGERLPRGGLRAASWWLTATGLAGALVALAQELVPSEGEDRSIPVGLPVGMALAAANEFRRRRWETADEGLFGEEDPQTSAAKSLGMGVGVGVALNVAAAGERVLATGVSRVLARVTAGSERVFRPVGHAVALSLVGVAIYELIRRADRKIEAGAETLEDAFSAAPSSSLVSGGPGSHVPWDTLSRQGRRNVSTALSTEMIANVMGQPAVAEPIRIFVGLESAPTQADRIELVMKEIERTGAFDRPLLMVISPTGTGYVNYVAVEAAEFMSLGNMASVTMQYSLRPSPLSLDRVADGRQQYRALIDAISNELRERPVKKRPRLVLFGESLGAWTSQDAFEHRGTQGLINAGVDRAIWIGSPYMSKWKEETLKSDRPDVDRALIGRFNDFGQLEALGPESRKQLRYVMITHDNDAVAHFGLDLLVRAPEWLGPAETRPATVPKAEQWRTPTTFVQTLVDMKNAANVIPGQFEAKGHDYRKDLARFVREVFALPATDAQLAEIEKALRANELERKAILDAAKEKAKSAKEAEKAAAEASKAAADPASPSRAGKTEGDGNGRAG
ncbi:MAG TPA: alpha/beta-hydrolase family protein [Actinomycetota bacterium]|nr:alpha/beta-hydrolase family protein [Actinomycetota bacterium]